MIKITISVGINMNLTTEPIETIADALVRGR